MYISFNNLHMRVSSLFFLFLIFMLPACNDNDNIRQLDTPEQPLYLEFKIWGEEEKETVTCLLQIRSEGPNGTALLLEPPAMVELNGEVMEADSAGLSGIFYEMSLPLREFSGKHTIRFTSMNGKVYEEEFEFSAFRLAHALRGEIPSQPFSIKIEGLPARETHLTLALTDTAYSTNDVHERVMVKDGELNITSEMLQKLRKGPVMMEILLDEERPLRLGNHRGKLATSYSLDREFVLE
jgi:hypothetical protein